MKFNKLKFQIALGKLQLTQTQFADKIGISRATISAVVNGKTCYPKTAVKIADALGVDVTELLED